MMPTQMLPQHGGGSQFSTPPMRGMGGGEHRQQHFMPFPPQMAAQQQTTAAGMMATMGTATSNLSSTNTTAAATSSSQSLKALLPSVPPNCGPPTVSLALLLDFAIHKTLHELHILTELNLRIRPEERKISVVQFAHSTRLIFVRILAIVRWLKTYKKFEPLISIRYLLDEQAARYVETADKLVEIARNELPNARLPVFQVPQAVDVLTLGTYPRLPQNIKDRFISIPPLEKREQRLTLRRLNRVLEFHLGQSAEELSPRIQQIQIRNGIATLVVPNEFEMALTRLGDRPQTKWCLLNIRILVENAEVGQGQQLVHPLQVNFLHQMVQERLNNGKKPLLEAYTLIHHFCRSLQLDVLYCQAMQMAKQSAQYLRVDEYDVKECRLAISYWLIRDARQPHRLGSKHKLIIYGERGDLHGELRTKHRPEGPELPRMDQSLSLQRILNETIFFRCQERLRQAQTILEKAQPKGAKINHSGHCLLSLSCPLMLVDECHLDESLTVTTNTFFGTVHCRVQMLGQRDEIRDLEHQLNSVVPSLPKISRILHRLRILILVERLQRALIGLQVRTISDVQAMPLVNKLGSLPADRSIFQFIREDQFYLVVTFHPDEQLGVKIQIHLFSAAEGRLTLLDLDAEQIIRTAPLPQLHSSSTRHGSAVADFFHRFQRRKEEEEGSSSSK